MCILFISVDPNPKKGSYRLIIASNRDEYYVRPAKQAFLCEKTQVIGGRDMENKREGGMWLGISLKQGGHYKLRFAALLNVTGEEKKSGVKGRGFLVKDYLDGSKQLNEYVNGLEKDGEPYNAYNLVAVEISDDVASVYHHSNKTDDVAYPGKQILAFGNSNPYSPLKKVLKGKERFEEVITKSNSVDSRKKLIDDLLQLLKWEERHLPDPELEKRAPDAFEYLSQVCVKLELAGYGTRTHSIVLVDDEWNVEFIESTMKEPIDIKNPMWETQYIKSQL